MTSLVIFAFGGVLQSGSGRPIEAGCRLYRDIGSILTRQVILVTAGEPGDARRFLDQQHLQAPAHISGPAGTSEWDWVLACGKLRRMYPYDVDWVIIPDPGIASALYYEGFRTMLFTDPRYTRPEWRPDAEPPGASSWDRLAQDLRTDQEAP